MKKIGNSKLNIVVLYLLLHITNANGQIDGIDGPPPPPEPPPSPINQWIIFMIIFGIFLGFYLIKKKQSKLTNK